MRFMLLMYRDEKWWDAKPEEERGAIRQRAVDVAEAIVTLKPGEGAEVKMEMSKGATVRYEWAAAGGPVNHDTHVDDPKGGTHSYRKGRRVEHDAGEITAVFDGHHGWFWRNRGNDAVTIALKTSGEYRSIKRM